MKLQDNVRAGSSSRRSSCATRSLRVRCTAAPAPAPAPVALPSTAHLSKPRRAGSPLGQVPALVLGLVSGIAQRLECRYHAEKGSARENGQQAEPSCRRGDGAAWQVCRRRAGATQRAKCQASCRERIRWHKQGTTSARIRDTSKRGHAPKREHKQNRGRGGGAPPPPQCLGALC